MTKRKKVLFVSAYSSTFVKQDLDILSNNYNVRTALFSRASKDPFYLIYTFITIFWRVLKTEISYAAFADLRAYFVVFWSKIFKKRSIVLIGGYEPAAIPEINYGGLLKKGQAKRFRYILKYADHILTYSEFSKNEVLRVYPVKQISVIHLGIVPDRNISLKPKKDYAVTIGDATESKWILKGLDNFARASLSYPEMKFIIIGNYSDEIRYKLLLINPGIEFTGYISQQELKKILSKTKIYCQLSLRESFGLSVLEAMKYGAIPVVTRAGSLPEVVGETGFLTEFNDIEKTIAAIEKAIDKGVPAQVSKRANEVFNIQFRESKLKTIIENL